MTPYREFIRPGGSRRPSWRLPGRLMVLFAAPIVMAALPGVQSAAANAPTALSVSTATGTYGGTTNLSATLTSGGIPIAGESVDFHIGATDLGTVITNVNGEADLNNVSLAGLNAGTYIGDVTAAFAGDTNFDPSAGADDLTVSQAQSSVSTAVDDSATTGAWGNTEVTGAAALDTASVSSPGSPGATVTYSWFDNGACSGLAATAQTVTYDSGSVPASAATTALGAGTYSYLVAYSGDANYASAAGTCQQFTVLPATAQVAGVVNDDATGLSWSGSEVTGASAQETGTVTGVAGFPPSGDVTYNFYTNGSCSSNATGSNQETLTGNGSAPADAASARLAAGSYSYQTTYSGDDNYVPRAGSCEPFVVAKATTGLTSTVDDAGIDMAWAGTETTGASAQDTSTVTGVSGFTPTGSVTYLLYQSSDCTGTQIAHQVVTTNPNGTVPSSTASPGLPAGSYGYVADYSGDPNYVAQTGACEPFSLAATTTTSSTSPPPPTTTTSASPAPPPAGSTTHLPARVIWDITTSGRSVTWCWGARACKYPATQLRFTLATSDTVRLVLEAKARGVWRKLAATNINGHKGINRFRIAGRWHGAFVPARTVKLLIEVEHDHRWVAHKQIVLTIRHGPAR
jgi:hypothetical protein